ncbi:MAG: hypothetical protein M1813_009613 [Trichoglossum hirsutum]|nr:MAG: hypothetical protein M1813_009613 [Trichoglossum hirsutum]
MALLDSLPIPEQLMPAVAIEKGQLLLNQWCHGEATRVLQDALGNAIKGGESAMDKWEVRLLRVMCAYAACLSKGDFKSGVQAMHDIRVWLECVALEDYTDIQVDCVQYYYSIALLGKLEMPCFDESRYGDFPRFVENDGLWAGMARVREYLQDKGRLVEALHLLTKELIFTIAGRKENAVRSFLDNCARCPTPSQPIWLLKRSARLLLSDFLRGSGSYSEARSELSEAQLISDKALPLSWGDIGRHNALLFSFEDAEMKNARDYDPIIMFDNWVEIANEAHSLENFRLVGRALCKAIIIADALGRQTCRPPWTERLFSIHARLEALYRKHGSVFWLLHGYSVTVPNFAVLTLTGCGDALEWIRAAKGEYHDFGFTGVMVRLEVGKRHLAMCVGADNLFDAAGEGESEALDREQTFWKSHVPPKIQVAPNVSDRKDSGLTLPRRYVLFSHVDKGVRELVEGFRTHPYESSEAEPNQAHWQLLLRWMREDYSQEILTREELRRIFPLAVHPGVSGDCWDIFLTQLNGHELRDQIMTCDIRQWGDIEDTISLWLGRAKHRSEMMREFFPCFLQWARLFCGEKIASDSAGVLITEAQKLIILLVSIESPNVREIFSRQSIAARRLICETRVDQIRQPKDSEDITSGLIEECVSEYSQIIDEDHTCGWQEGLALDLIESVRLRLFAKSKHFDFSIEDMIRDLDRAVDVFTDLRRGFTASGVIESVRNQEAQMSYYRPYDPYQLAATALINEPETENRDTMMWDFIQRAKARALGEFMEMEMVLTDSMIEKESLSPESVQLLLDEKAILASLEETDCPTQRAQLREMHKGILSRMQLQPDLITIAKVIQEVACEVMDMHLRTVVVGERRSPL